MATAPDARSRETLKVAGIVQDVLRRHGIECVLIGALALAHHGYVRATEDVDLAVRAPLAALRSVAAELRETGFDATLEEPDGDDPLGGVLTLAGPDFDQVKVVDFEGRFPRLVDEALARGERLEGEAGLRVTDLGTLVLFKLYAGGAKSALDLLELLRRHPELDLEALRQRARTVRLGAALERVLAMKD